MEPAAEYAEPATDARREERLGKGQLERWGGALALTGSPSDGGREGKGKRRLRKN